MENLKARLLDHCHDYVNQRIMTATQAMNNAQAAANEEGKSSAGDKYETGRAMMQIERDKAAQQLEEALKLKKVLDGLDSSIVSKSVRLGSVVKTTNASFYMAISAGKCLVGTAQYFAVSPISPIGKLLSGLTEGDQFLFNSKTEVITYVG
jgi:transcription elongation GreA/GreB family factor